MSAGSRDNRLLYRFGWYDASGGIHEADSAYTDHRQAMEALAPACEARKAARLPQISMILVYQLRSMVPVIILLDEAPMPNDVR
jgi:hypothetical protein